ncbi:Nuclear and cytoplasmic polyadenylated RNA-binding protein PUB1 [Candida viswanathii]|uniref:Nuclear and cytoplasmic polyadenylated RNA-binding protein PUB1 n=1 Tax=Candida viswanathii TaxID=5486 RepID=A0A367YH94_9ASCO|nr:Nuclear and cytoplasmic polyadenylated RNA-binding protein PUB1 [Candida viswanathii]
MSESTKPEEQSQQPVETPSTESTPEQVSSQGQEQQPQPQQQQAEEQPTSTSTPPEEPPLTPASATEGGREVSNTILYVGNLPKSASEEMVKELFSVGGNPIKTIKVLNDKNKAGFNYAFIEYDTNDNADMALNTLNGRVIDNAEIKVNWAYQSATIANTLNNEEPLFNIFVGDLSPEVNDEGLKNAFSKFGSLKQAHVMWDMQTSRSRGYGFVTFTEQADAELALQTMNGEWLGGRAIRCNWASHKQQQYNNQHGNGFRNYRNNNRQFRQYSNGNNNNNNKNGNGFPQNMIPSNQYINQQVPPGAPPLQLQQPPQLMLPGLNSGNIGQGAPINGQGNVNSNVNNSGGLPVMSPQSFDIVLRQTPSWQTTVYLGNIAHFTQQQEIIPLLQNFGFIVDFKFHPERGCAFVKYDTHERAALAIIQLAGFNLNGRPLKCGWGKERPPQFQNFPRNGNAPHQYMGGPGRP